jgi:hypothetical protein
VFADWLRQHPGVEIIFAIVQAHTPKAVSKARLTKSRAPIVSTSRPTRVELMFLADGDSGGFFKQLTNSSL